MWVSDAERGCVLPGQVFQHPAGGRAASKQADDDADCDQHPDKPGFQHLAIALQQRAGGYLRSKPRPQPVRDGRVGDDAGSHDQAERHEQPDLGQQHLAENRGVAEGAVPQPVGPHAGENGKGHDQYRDNDQCRQNGAPSPADPQTAQTHLSSTAPTSLVVSGTTQLVRAVPRCVRTCSCQRMRLFRGQLGIPSLLG